MAGVKERRQQHAHEMEEIRNFFDALEKREGKKPQPRKPSKYKHLFGGRSKWLR